MKNKIIFISICLSFLGAAIGIAGYYALTVPVYTLHFIHTNDLHAHLLPFHPEKSVCAYDDETCRGGLARIRSFIDSYRAQYPDAILLDGGDRFSGTFFYTVNKGADIIRLLNQMNYDAVTLGNHDFDDGLPEIEKMMQKITAPVVSANVVFPSKRKAEKSIQPAVVLNKNGVKIGVIGLMTPDITTETKGGGGVNLLPISQIVPLQIKALKKEGVKVIVLLSHTGDKMEEQLAKNFKDVDIVIGAHSHTKKFLPFAGADGQTVLVSSAGYGGETVGAFSVAFNWRGQIIRYQNEARDIDNSLFPNVEMKHEIENIVVRLDKQVRKPVTFAYLPVWIQKQAKAALKNTARKKGKFCLEACYIGEVLSDALLKTDPTADFAFINSGGIRAGLPQGDVTIRDLIEAYPFDSSVVLIQMTGMEIKKYLSHGLSTFNKGRANGFIQAAGLSYTYQNRMGLKSVKTQRGALQKDKVYNVLVPGFLAEGGDGFPVYRVVREVAPSLRSAVAHVMRKRDYHIPPFEKRIRKLNK